MKTILPVAVAAAASPAGAGDGVVLLHGLARTPASMNRMARVLASEGYAVVNIGYPSRQQPVPVLAESVIPAALAQCRSRGADRIHFVTHSMGGILVRWYLEHHRVPELGRVVMLSPPNQGSEVVDKLADLPGFQWLNGPAGRQLGTGDDSLPRRLGPASFEVGILTGNRSVNPILSRLIPGPDDGKVAVSRARLEGMADFLVLPCSHPFIMRADAAIRQTLHFIAHGRFSRPKRLQGTPPAALPGT